MMQRVGTLPIPANLRESKIVKLVKISIVAATFACNLASAASSTLNVTVDQITHQFSGRYSLDYIVGSNYGAAPIPSFTASLSSIDSLTLRISAPVGELFEIDANPRSIGRVFSGSVQWLAPNYSFAGIDRFLPATFSLESLTGSAPNSTTNFQASADRRKISGPEPVFLYSNAAMTFSAFVWTIDLTPLAGTNIPVQTFKPFSYSSLYLQDVYASPSLAADPGPSLRLIADVPEPSTWILMMAGVFCLTGAARRMKN